MEVEAAAVVAVSNVGSPATSHASALIQTHHGVAGAEVAAGAAVAAAVGARLHPVTMAGGAPHQTQTRPRGVRVLEVGVEAEGLAVRASPTRIPGRQALGGRLEQTRAHRRILAVSEVRPTRSHPRPQMNVGTQILRRRRHPRQFRAKRR